MIDPVPQRSLSTPAPRRRVALTPCVRSATAPERAAVLQTTRATRTRAVDPSVYSAQTVPQTAPACATSVKTLVPVCALSSRSAPLSTTSRRAPVRQATLAIHSCRAQLCNKHQVSWSSVVYYICSHNKVMIFSIQYK